MEMMSERDIDYFNMKSAHNHHKDDLQSSDWTLNTVRCWNKRGALAQGGLKVISCFFFIYLIFVVS